MEGGVWVGEQLLLAKSRLMAPIQSALPRCPFMNCTTSVDFITMTNIITDWYWKHSVFNKDQGAQKNISSPSSPPSSWAIYYDFDHRSSHIGVQRICRALHWHTGKLRSREAEKCEAWYLFIGPDYDHRLPLSITDSFSVDLIDVTLAVEDSNSKLFGVVAVAVDIGDNIEDRFVTAGQARQHLDNSFSTFSYSFQYFLSKNRNTLLQLVCIFIIQGVSE